MIIEVIPVYLGAHTVSIDIFSIEYKGSKLNSL